MGRDNSPAPLLAQEERVATELALADLSCCETVRYQFHSPQATRWKMAGWKRNSIKIAVA